MTLPSSLKRKEILIEKDPLQGMPSSLRKKQPKESIPENVNRQLGRTGLRIAETVLGAPRAFGEFGEMLVPEKLIKKGAEKIGLREPVEKGLEFAKEHAPYKLFPKSEDIRELNKTIFGSKAEPKNEWEAKADETISDFAALAIPLPGSQFKVLKPALLALGSNLAAEGVGQLGASEKQKTFTKIGTILLGSMINPKAAEKLKESLFADARSKRPEGATVSSTVLGTSIDHLENQFRKGGIADSDKPALQKIADIRSEFQGAQIPVESLERLKVKINEARNAIYKQLEGNKSGIKSAKRNLDLVSQTVDDALKLYGKQNPEWEALYRPANEVHGAIAQSHRARNWIGRNLKKIGFAHLLAELGLYQLGGFPAAALTTAGAGMGFMGAELAARFMKSPTLRKYYMQSITSALKEDAVALHENLKKLDKEMKKDRANPKH